jgi:hypothetical protein
MTPLYLTLSPVLWQWGVIPILDTQPSLMTMKCHSYTWYTVHSYDNEVSFLYLTLSPSLMTMRCLSYTWHSAQSYDNEVSFLSLTLSPVLWQWGVFPILDTQSILMTMKCHSYTWYTVHSYDNEVSFLCLTLSRMTPHCHKTGLSVKYRNDTSLS